MVEDQLSDAYWVRAELSEVRVSQKGHCFVELVEKEDGSNSIVAKARAVVMRNVYPLLKMNFEDTTGQAFCAGLEVLLQVTVSFSEVYGYSLIVQDIDPTYTMGSMAQRRKEILDRLKREGVADMNRELDLPVLMQRIAVVSSPTAAGYEDFCKQLDHNRGGFRFVHRLFPALMQGEETERSVIAALDAIASEMEDWDVVAIIRGGGAVSDLSCFDTYPLANCCAQFPLPILTGIGHERDVSVLDLVANKQLKTPTAVAAFLVESMEETAQDLALLEEELNDVVKNILDRESERLDRVVRSMEYIARTYCSDRLGRVQAFHARIRQAAQHVVKMTTMDLVNKDRMLTEKIQIQLQLEQHRIRIWEASVKAHDPEHILNLGYSITYKDGRAVKDGRQLKAGDELTTQLAQGKIVSIVK